MITLEADSDTGSLARKMAMDAQHAGKHVYLEKPMCQTAEEAQYSLKEILFNKTDS